LVARKKLGSTISRPLLGGIRLARLIVFINLFRAAAIILLENRIWLKALLDLAAVL
jgi:hypothetical protein